MYSSYTRARSPTSPTDLINLEMPSAHDKSMIHGSRFRQDVASERSRCFS